MRLCYIRVCDVIVEFTLGSKWRTQMVTLTARTNIHYFFKANTYVKVVKHILSKFNLI